MSEEKERTLVLVKPDGVKRGLVGQIMKRFEKRGFDVSSHWHSLLVTINSNVTFRWSP